VFFLSPPTISNDAGYSVPKQLNETAQITLRPAGLNTFSNWCNEWIIVIVEAEIQSFVKNEAAMGSSTFSWNAERVYSTLFWLPNVDLHIVLIQSDVEIMKYCSRQKGGGGGILFHGILYICAQKGKIHELVHHFSTGLKTREFFL